MKMLTQRYSNFLTDVGLLNIKSIMCTKIYTHILRKSHKVFPTISGAVKHVVSGLE